MTYECAYRELGILLTRFHFSLEKKYKIDYHEDIYDAVYETRCKKKFPASFADAPDKRVVYETHKIGGYPTYIQDTPEMPADYPFVMQINFDADAELYIADCGSYYLYYNARRTIGASTQTAINTTRHTPLVLHRRPLCRKKHCCCKFCCGFAGEMDYHR